MKSDTEWAEILASLDSSAAELSAEDLARIDGLPHKQSDSNSTGSALGNMDPGQPSGSRPPMTKAQIEQYNAMFAETRKFQDECDDARWANETPEEFERIRSILRQRNNIYPGDDVEGSSIQWALPIGTALPYPPDWVRPNEDQEYKKKLAIARMLPTIRPELYVPGRNVYPSFPPLNPRVKAHYFPDAPPDIMAPAPEQPSDLVKESGEEENVSPVTLQPRTFAVLRGPDYRYSEELAARIVPATPYGFSTGRGLSPRISPRGQPYGHCDSNGVFHPLPSLPTPERLQQLEERKRDEPRELPSPSISRLRKSPSSYGTLYGTSNSMSNSGSPAPQPKSILRNKASRAYLTSESEEDLNAASMDVNTDTRHEVNTSANDEISIAENISEIQLKPAIKKANLTEQFSSFNMEKSGPTDNMEGLVKETNITSDKKIAKKKRSFYNLKQSFSFTKLNQSLLHSGARDNTAPINEDSSNTGLEQSSSATKRNKPVVTFDTTPEKADAEKKSGFKNFMKSMSPRKRSGTIAQTKEAGMSTDALSPRERSGTVAQTKEADLSINKNTASVHFLGDGLPAGADRVKGSAVEPVYITVVKSPKHGGLREQMRKLRNNNADDRFAEDISFDCEPDEEVDDILLDLAKAGITDMKSSKKQKSPQAEKGGRYPAIYTSTGVRLDGSLVAEYAGMGSLGRSNSTARGLEARKLAEVQAVDGERSEAERYVSTLCYYRC